MWDADTVDFPSGGKLCPHTILTQNDKLTGQQKPEKGRAL
jgi:hypothetical protein